MAIKCPKCHSENPETKQFCADCGTQLPPPQVHPPVVTETLQAAIHELTTGSTFAGRYQVIEEIGHGGMGRVYKVQDTDIKEKVALKLLRPEITLDKEAIERFSNELKLARKISHRHVCRMFDLGRAEGTTFITMEFVPGEDLKSFLHRSKQLNIGTALSIIRQVCEGLDEAHRLGIVHRDLKPANIMIDKDGDAKIMDFGIARSLSGRGITGAGILIGTPEYMSPEQVEGKDIDQRSDIYSLAVILYEMVTGKLPFSGDTPLSVAHQHKYEAPEDPKKFNPQLPDDLARVILKGLAKDKDKRFQSAAELGMEFGRIEKGLPTTERHPPERKPFTSKEITVKFRPKKLIIPALVGVALIAAAVFFWPKRALDLDPDLVTVAIFENKTGDASLANIGRMVADSVAQGLTEIKGLDVVSPATVENATGELKGGDYVRHLAERTRAGHVVSGACFLQAGTLHFQAQVNEGGKGKLVYALDPVTGPVLSIADTIEKLKGEIMGAIASLHDSEVREFLDHGIKAPNYGAYLEFRAGIDIFNGGEQARALDYYKRALDRDPDFKIPMTGMSAVYMNLGRWAELEELRKRALGIRDSLDDLTEIYVIDYAGARLLGDLEAMYRAQKRISGMFADEWNNYSLALASIRVNRPREAVVLLKALDPKSAYIKDWLGYWQQLTWAYHLLGDHNKEIDEARRGLAQHPQNAAALDYSIRALAAMGRIEDLNRSIDEKLALPPQPQSSAGRSMLTASNELRAHGFLEASKSMAMRAAEWVARLPRETALSNEGRNVLFMALHNQEKWRESRAVVEELYKKNPKGWGYLGTLGVLSARQGDYAEAQRISKELENINEPYTFGGPTLWQARIASVLGNKEEAVVLIREALAKGQSIASLHGDMNFESLRDYLAFKELTKPKG